MIRGKNVIRVAFFTVSLGILFGVFYYRYFLIHNVLINKIIDSNQQTALSYSKIVLDENPAYIKLLNSNSYQQNFFTPTYNDFLQKSFKFFDFINVEQIIVYNNLFIKLLSSNSKIILPEDKDYYFHNIFHLFDQFFYETLNDSDSIQKIVYEGKSDYKILYNLSISDNDKVNGKVKKNNQYIIKTYFPILDYNNFRVNGVIEIIRNITDDINQIDNFTFTSLLIFFAVFILLFIIFFITTLNVQKVINEQIKMNRELEDSKLNAERESSAKTEFLANVTHELRTPLNSIIGFSEIIINKFDKVSNEKYIDYINDINVSGKHLLEIINDILDFSKASSEKLKVENIDIDLNKICQSSMRFVKPKADQANINLVELLPNEHIVIKADPKRLKQALLNLLSNSVKFTPSGGTISIEIKIDKIEGNVLIIVKDTGIGISQKDIPKALSVFGQVDNKLNRKYEGTGLGLPLTKKLIELMDGEFNISSKENIGTIVTLVFKYDSDSSYVEI
jgi:two-component system cell cycle sensor histidine kinase PleC